MALDLGGELCDAQLQYDLKRDISRTLHLLQQLSENEWFFRVDLAV